LECLSIQATQDIIDLLFSEIDLDNDGWITYVIYFLFLKYYFGSLSLCGKVESKPVEPVLSDLDKFLLAYKDLSAWDRFVRIIVDQLRVIFFRYDANKNQVFEIDEIKEILEKVFGFDRNEIEYILLTYFTFLNTQNSSVTFEQLIAIILSIYFVEIVFHRRYKSTDNEVWKTKKISLEEFIALITESCFFIRYKVPREDLVFIFNELDTDKDGFITFQQYVDFIKKYLGNGIDFWKKPEVKPAPGDVSEEEFAFVGAIWDELKVYFDKYDQGKKGFLNEAELKAFVIEVLNETTERELNYVFWNLFRVDSNANKEVDFQEFVQFLLYRLPSS
jgi:Ca2+-binding EF-hand superfamily protein